MKKEKKLIFTLGVFLYSIFLISFLSASTCSLSVKLLNQDPYPVTPGDYVKLVFQIDGVSNPDCGQVAFQLKDNYPISFDPGESSIYTVNSGSYAVNYGSFLTVPFKVRVSADAVNGDNPIETALTRDAGSVTLDNFTISIENLKSDFDVHVKNYDSSTNTLTLEILNIGKSDVKAITVTIPHQEGIVVKGSNKNIVGDLDSNEYTTADFEVTGKGLVTLQIDYTDKTDVRRTLSKQVDFDPTDFMNRKKDEKKTSPLTYFILLLVLGGIGYFVYKKFIKKKKASF